MAKDSMRRSTWIGLVYWPDIHTFYSCIVNVLSLLEGNCCWKLAHASSDTGRNWKSYFAMMVIWNIIRSKGVHLLHLHSKQFDVLINQPIWKMCNFLLINDRERDITQWFLRMYREVKFFLLLLHHSMEIKIIKFYIPSGEYIFLIYVSGHLFV